MVLALSTFTALYNYCHHLSPELTYHPGQKLCAQETVTPLSLFPTVPGNLSSTFHLCKFAFSRYLM